MNGVNSTLLRSSALNGQNPSLEPLSETSNLLSAQQEQLSLDALHLRDQSNATSNLKLLNALSDDALTLITRYLPVQDSLALESTCKAIKKLAEKNQEFGRKRDFVINKGIQSLEELKDVKPLCDSLTARGYQIHLKLDFNQPLTEGVIPKGVQHITFGDDFDQLLIEGVIPKGVQDITFGYNFNQPLTEGVIPKGLQHITFGEGFDQPLTEGVFPKGVQHITFGDWFDQPLTEGVIPEGVQHITFGYEFNQPLTKGVIPEGVRLITFGRNFNQPLTKGAIPEGAKIVV